MSSVCLEPGCPEFATHRGRCHKHARTRQRQINQDREAQRRIYNSRRWRITRSTYLFKHPLCAHPECETIATDVHHIIDIIEGGSPWDHQNLEGLCRVHHSQITRARQQQPV